MKKSFDIKPKIDGHRKPKGAMSRRDFLKFCGVAATTAVFPGCTLGKKKWTPKIPEISPEGDQWSSLCYDVIRDIEKPSILRSQAQEIMQALDIPWGEWAPVGVSGPLTDEKQTPEEFAKGTQIEEEIWEQLTSFNGIEINEEGTVISLDPRDGPLARGVIPPRLTAALNLVDSRIAPIIQIKIDEQKRILEKYRETEEDLEADLPLHIFRMPGGSTVIPLGYQHIPDYQNEHGKHLAEICKYADLISIEGFSDYPFGKSLEKHWSTPVGHYGEIMHKLAELKFSGHFTEVDPRDSKYGEIIMERIPIFKVFPKLPSDFLEAYKTYLEKRAPDLAKLIDVIFTRGLEYVLEKNSTSRSGLKTIDSSNRGIKHFSGSYLGFFNEAEKLPTRLEFGEKLFSDATSAIRLHMLAQLQAEELLSGNCIVDIEGAAHLPSKNFFIRYPIYAMEVILRQPQFATMHLVDPKDGISGVTKILKDLEDPEKGIDIWTDVLWQLGKIPLYKIEDNEEKTLNPGIYEFIKFQVEPELKTIREKAEYDIHELARLTMRWFKELKDFGLDEQKIQVILETIDFPEDQRREELARVGIDFTPHQRALIDQSRNYWQLRGMSYEEVRDIAKRMVESK